MRVPHISLLIVFAGLLRFALPRALVIVLLAAALPAWAVEDLRHGQGLLWRVESPGTAPSYILGTMHSTDPEVLDLPDPVRQAFAQADSLALELVMDEAVHAQLGAAMLLSDGRSLDAILGAERFAAVTAAGALYGLPPQALRLFEPWAAMTVFSVSPTEFKRNAAGAVPLDQALQLEAQRLGKPVHGLESVSEQIEVFSGIPEDEQIALLDQVLRDHPKIEQWFERIKQAYLAQDVADIYALMTEQAAGADPELLEGFEDRLILARNETMAERMAGLLDAGNAFVAVGALHLPGERGILHLLELDGRRVERVY